MKKLLVKYLNGIASYTEQKELLEWLRNDGNLKDFENGKRNWSIETMQKPMNLHTAHKWSKVREKISQQVIIDRLKYKYSVSKYVAVALLLISLTSAFLLYKNIGVDPNTVRTKVSTENGQVSKVSLPDGSEIWINAASELTYDNKFGITNRDLHLTGEAFFKVEKDKKLPFRVKSGELTVTAVGTEFNVSNYEETGKIYVVLKEGAVKINSSRDKDFEMKLVPNEMASYNRGTGKIERTGVVTEHFTSWKEGIIHFNKLSMEQIVFKLEKRYNQKFTMDDEVRNLHFNLTISNENLNDILSIIETISNVRTQIRGDTIHFELNN